MCLVAVVVHGCAGGSGGVFVRCSFACCLMYLRMLLNCASRVILSSRSLVVSLEIVCLAASKFVSCCACCCYYYCHCCYCRCYCCCYCCSCCCDGCLLLAFSSCWWLLESLCAGTYGYCLRWPSGSPPEPVSKIRVCSMLLLSVLSMSLLLLSLLFLPLL